MATRVLARAAPLARRPRVCRLALAPVRLVSSAAAAGNAAAPPRQRVSMAVLENAPLVTPRAPTSERQLSEKEREFLAAALRVNQAGELGANLIYAGQAQVFRRDARLHALIQHMWEQEKHHLKVFDTLIAKHRVRPTAMRPLWNVGAYAMGWVTATMGEKAAMACTEAVETEIGGHYNNQLRVLLDMLKDNKELLENGELRELVEVIREFRDDELEHLDTAVEHDAKKADGYEILHNGIRGLCRAAIKISEKI